MRYELMIILPPGAPAEGAKHLEVVNTLITKTGGKVENTQVWGERALAYPIEHQQRGTYVVLDISMETSAVAKLNTALDLQQEVVRHMITQKVAAPKATVTTKEQVVVKPEMKIELGL